MVTWWFRSSARSSGFGPVFGNQLRQYVLHDFRLFLYLLEVLLEGAWGDRHRVGRRRYYHHRVDRGLGNGLFLPGSRAGGRVAAFHHGVGPPEAFREQQGVVLPLQPLHLGPQGVLHHVFDLPLPLPLFPFGAAHGFVGRDVPGGPGLVPNV